MIWSGKTKFESSISVDINLNKICIIPIFKKEGMRYMLSLLIKQHITRYHDSN